MKLCFSTFSKVLLLCKLHNTTQENLIRAVFASIPNFYDASLDSSAVTNVVKGKKNLPDDALQKAKPEVAEEIYLEFKKKVFPLLDEGKFDVLVRDLGSNKKGFLLIRFKSDSNANKKLDLPVP